MNKQEAINTFSESADGLLQQLALFNPGSFSQVPFEGSWTAGQVADHLLRSASGLPELLQGDTRPTDREADALTGPISNIFLDFSTRLQAPDFILPSAPPHEQQAMIDALAKVTGQIKETAAPMDLSLTCAGFPFPQLGEMTRLEWIYFAGCHFKRHTLQLQRIAERLKDLPS